MSYFLFFFLLLLVGIIVAFALPQTRRPAVTYAVMIGGDLWYRVAFGRLLSSHKSGRMIKRCSLPLPVCRVRFRKLQRWWKNRKNPAVKSDGNGALDDDEAAGPDVCRSY
jgi:hypothetical protein